MSNKDGKHIPADHPDNIGLIPGVNDHYESDNSKYQVRNQDLVNEARSDINNGNTELPKLEPSASNLEIIQPAVINANSNEQLTINPTMGNSVPANTNENSPVNSLEITTVPVSNDGKNHNADLIDNTSAGFAVTAKATHVDQDSKQGEANKNEVDGSKQSEVKSNVAKVSMPKTNEAKISSKENPLDKLKSNK